MATTAIGLPIFEGKATDDIDTFIRLYMGYLNTINVNPYAAGGPPESWKRAMCILISCMSGEAAEWFDREITGKNWELSLGEYKLGEPKITETTAISKGLTYFSPLSVEAALINKSRSFVPSNTSSTRFSSLSPAVLHLTSSLSIQ